MRPAKAGLLAAAVAAGAAENGARVEIAEITSPPPRADAVAQWVAEGSRGWAAGKPAFVCGDKTRGVTAQGWLAVSDSAFHLRVVVDDRHHVPPPDSVQLWEADGIEVGLDMRGDRAGALPKESEIVSGPDDAKFIVALTREGPVGRCMQADREANTGPLPSGWVSAQRDEKKGQTAYELTIPWSRFETSPGLFPTFGLGLQVNDRDPGRNERAIVNWGEGTFGNMRPGLFKTVAIAAPAGPVAALAVTRDIIWGAAEPGEVAVAAGGVARIEAELAGVRRELALKAGAGMRRYAVKLFAGPGAPRELPFAVRLLDTAGNVLAEQNGVVSVAGAVMQALQEGLDRALETATHPLFRRHLLSVKAIAADEWARLTLYRESGQRGDPRKTLDYVRSVLAGFEADAGEWEPYRQGRRDLYMAYVSRLDRTVQFYVLSLPRDWDPKKKYPLFVELHGAGNENFMSDLSARLGPRGQALDLAGYEDHRSEIQRQGLGYYIMPSGRGNLGYRGPGEEDVWEAYDDVHKLFSIDPDRRYLFGFSMGGGGTWSLGVRTPDRWAALMIMAGGMWREAEGLALGRNLSYVPVHIWCGEADGLFANVARMKAELEKYGNTPKVTTVPGLGHNYTKEIQKECAEWLPSHVRRRPDRFTFAADTDQHLGVWGIRMVRDLRVSGLPSFTCEITGATVTITSEGTPGLTVDLGKEGLGLTGDVTVTWNGKQAYQGPVKEITLGDVPRREGRR